MEGKVVEADEADIPRRRKGAAPPSSHTDHDPQTGEVLEGKAAPEPKPDLTQVAATTRGFVAKLVDRAADTGAWETAIGVAAERLRGNDLACARLVLRHAQRAVPDKVRTATAELVLRAGKAGAWKGAMDYLTKLHADGKLSDLELEFARTEVELAQSEAATMKAAS
jgi:hypothetical protein